MRRIIVLLLIYFSTTFGANSSDSQEKFVLACDGEEANFSCPEGQVISAFPVANYGRYSIQVCNDGDADLPVNCILPATISILNARCLGRVNCTLAVSESEFGEKSFSEECRGKAKYLDAKYKCSSQSTTTTTTAKSVQAEAGGEGNHLIGGEERTTAAPAKPEQTAARRRCPATRREELHWPATLAGLDQAIPCPSGSTGTATWVCSSTGEWSSSGPSLTGCSSGWLRGLAQRGEKAAADKNAADLLEDSLKVSQEVRRESERRNVLPGDLPLLLSVMQNLSRPYGDGLAWTGLSTAKPFIKNMLSTASSLIRSEGAWRGWRGEEKRSMAGRLLEEVEFLAAGHTTSSDVDEKPGSVAQYYHERDIDMQLHFFRPSGLHEQGHLLMPSLVQWYPSSHDSVLLPSEAFSLTPNASFVYYANFDGLQEQLKPKKDEAARIVSRILAVSVMIDTKILKVDLEQDWIQLLFHHNSSALAGLSSPRCVWWSAAEEDWESAGCRVESHNSSLTVCQCSHLTHFAVLMELSQNNQLSAEDVRVLTWLTYLGCCLSIVCLLLTALLLCLFSPGGGDRVFIHKNLCITLAAAQTLFLLAIWRTENPMLCRVVAATELYLLLAALCWMLLEGVQLYFLLVDVFSTETRRCRFAFFAFSFPAFVVSSALFYDANSFGTSQYCWLRKDSVVFVAFLCLVGLIMTMNWLSLAMALRIVCRHSSRGYLPCRRAGESRRGRTWLRGSAALAVLLGLSWTLGFLWMRNESSVIFAYSFTVANSLQGLFIFLFHVVGCEKLRSAMREWLACHGCACLSSPSPSSCRKPGTGSSPASDSATEFMYPPAPLYQPTPRSLYHHPNFLAHQATLREHYGGDYATIVYGEMVGRVDDCGWQQQLPPLSASSFYSPCNSHHTSPPFCRPGISLPPQHTSLSNNQPRKHPPEVPFNLPSERCMALLQIDPPLPPSSYTSRRPPSSKMSEDSAYSESSMLTAELTPSGATVFRMDMKRNPPPVYQDL